MPKLDGLVAVVTGAGRGIGETIARSLDAEGARLVVSDLSGAEGRVAAGLRHDSLAVQADVSRDSDVEALIRQTVEKFGRLDILVNNAGIDGELRPLAETSLEDFDRVVAVNLRGVFLGMRHAIPAMLGNGGSIINIASVAGLVALAGTSAYAASKAGVMGMTRVAAAEYGPAGIRVNAICPGVIETPMLKELEQTDPETHAQLIAHAEAATAARRLGRTEEIATLATYLASADSSFITGAAIPVDGGYTAL